VPSEAAQPVAEHAEFIDLRVVNLDRRLVLNFPLLAGDP
jgi:hypothetical protein